MWTEGSLSAGIVDTLSTEEQLSQWEKGSEAATQTVTQSKHSYWVFVDFTHAWALKQQRNAKHCSGVSYMCMPAEHTVNLTTYCIAKKDKIGLKKKKAAVTVSLILKCKTVLTVHSFFTFILPGTLSRTVFTNLFCTVYCSLSARMAI